MSLSDYDLKCEVLSCLDKTSIFGNSQLNDVIRNRSLIPKQIYLIVWCILLTIYGLFLISISRIEVYYMEKVLSLTLCSTQRSKSLIRSILSHVGLVRFIRFIGQMYSIKYKLLTCLRWHLDVFVMYEALFQFLLIRYLLHLSI